jgi:hypothetical protein
MMDVFVKEMIRLQTKQDSEAFVAAKKSASNTILSGKIAAFGTESICKRRLVIRQSFISFIYCSF